jgi:hypothetical protein
MEFSTILTTPKRQNQINSLLAPETLHRRLVDQTGGVDTKETKNFLATTQNRITIPNEIWKFQ